MARARATDSDRLVKAAARVFRAKGYRNTTIDDIADAARVSRPTVYTYAKSKRWMLDRIVQGLLNDLAARLQSAVEGEDTSYGRLRAVIRTHVEAAATNRTFYEVVFSEQNELSPAARKRFRVWAHEVTRDFKDLLEPCIRDSRVELDPSAAANLIVGMLTSVHRWYDPRGPLSADELTDQILTLLSGILTENPEPARG